MNYEKKYKEALERARKLEENSNGMILKKWLWNIFPELKESGDEKVRKEIIRFIRMEVEDEIVGNKWLAWLEKQKGNIGGISPNWSEEDEKNLRRAIRATKVVYPVAADWLQSLQDRVGCEANCTTTKEWSEEDEELVKWSIHNLTELKDRYGEEYGKVGKCIDWLKSLQDRVQPQPKQEWSEEDINMIDWLIRCCEEEHKELCNDKYGHQDIVSDLKRDCQKKWDWLESLKNRVAPQNNWKPSDNELEVLRLVAEKDGTCLMGLYEQLKKLKEE